MAPNRSFFILLCWTSLVHAFHAVQRVQLGLAQNRTTKPLTPDDCWDSDLKNAEVFHLHIPKTAGCSTVHDVAEIIGRDNLWSHETCFALSNFATFSHTLVMLRRPRDHVFSMYHHCKAGGGPAWHVMMSSIGAAPGQENWTLPDTFGEWVQRWAQHPKFGQETVFTDEYHCYFPHDLQSVRLTCWDPSAAYPVNPQDALRNMSSASLVGVVEAYQESVCLFHAKLKGSVPSHCNCEDPAAWASFPQADDDHGISYIGTVDDESDGVLEFVDHLTQVDRVLYNASVERFIQDIKAVEKQVGVKVLCQDRESALRRKQTIPKSL
mmetsp:Transcript_45066/g.84106  ORF Transcript_45066/g.84106 Transcript_45066/m.84106 type:complete len:323 (+) Transcript_45066:71-1039(+)